MAKYRLKAVDGRLLRTGSKSEAQAMKHFTDQGWNVYTRGWPDFLLVRAGDAPRLVEVKGKSKYHLKPNQTRIAAQLKAFGLAVELWAPDSIFPPAKPSPEV